MTEVQQQHLMDVNEIAQYLNVSKQTIYYWVNLEFIPFVKMGWLLRFRRDEVDRWLAKKSSKGRNTIRVEV